MKVIQMLLGFLVIGFFIQCVSVLPRQERRLEKVHTTELSQNQIYNRSLVFLSKSLGNGNFAIQIREEKKGRIVSKGLIKIQNFNPCTYSCDLEFNIDLSAKDRKYRIIFDDILMWSYNQFGARIKIISPRSQSDLKELYKDHFEALEKELVDSIEGRSVAPPEDF